MSDSSRQPGGRPLRERTVVLLDAGGTLITLDHERMKPALGPDGSDIDERRLAQAETIARRWADAGVRRRVGARELWDGYFERLLSHAGLAHGELPRAIERLWEMNQELSLWRRPVPGARETLERLAEGGRRLAVVSNAEGRVERDLREAGFGDLLETVVDSHRVGVAKPDPRIFKIALERLGARTDDAVYVGDVPAFDVEGARAAGIPPILLDEFDAYPETSASRIRTIKELPSLLGL